MRTPASAGRGGCAGSGNRLTRSAQDTAGAVRGPGGGTLSLPLPGRRRGRAAPVSLGGPYAAPPAPLRAPARLAAGLRGEVVRPPRSKGTPRRCRGVVLQLALGPARLQARFRGPPPQYC